MHIAYVSSFDPHNVSSWSGTGYFIAEALKNTQHKVSFIGPLTENGALLSKLRQQFYASIFQKKHIRGFDENILQGYARQIAKQLHRVQPDVIFSVWSLPIIDLETDIPISFTADALFSLMKDFYPDWSNITEATKINGINSDIKSLAKASAAIYCSDWVADEAIQQYKTPKEKVHVVPYGANIHKDFIPNAQQVIRTSRQDSCSLLFLGVDWRRKGGDIVFNTLKHLRNSGVNAELTICGCVPPKEVAEHKYVKVIPYLNKNNKSDLHVLCTLLKESAFLFLPTRAEAFGIVFCEASAFGLPSISTSVGGVSTAVKNNVNGYLLPYEAQHEDYAKLICDIWYDTSRYTSLSESSRLLYENELNWDIAIAKISTILEGIAK
ncbi:MAG: glycosyltransferase family 4 protein [Candidatus Kapaibacterium sp.]|jgi:glycosyltransferase involved in cell wall biosynthesis